MLPPEIEKIEQRFFCDVLRLQAVELLLTEGKQSSNNSFPQPIRASKEAIDESRGNERKDEEQDDDG